MLGISDLQHISLRPPTSHVQQPHWLVATMLDRTGEMDEVSLGVTVLALYTHHHQEAMEGPKPRVPGEELLIHFPRRPGILRVPQDEEI